jgi:hypothetical protein
MPNLNPELMRNILLEIETRQPTSFIGEVEIDGLEPKVVSYHIQMLHEAGLVDGVNTSTAGDNFSWVVRSMTYQGHRLLDGIRSDTAWAAVKTEARKRSLDLTFEAVKAIAMRLLQQAVGAIG